MAEVEIRFKADKKVEGIPSEAIIQKGYVKLMLEE